MGLFGEDVFEIGTPGWDGSFDWFLLLGNFGGNGGFGDDFSVQPLLSFPDEVFDLVVDVQPKALEEMILRFQVLP